MRTLQQRVQDVSDAYTWEQTQISQWKIIMNQTALPQPNNLLEKFFEGIWNSYFDNVTLSNDVIIQICQAGLGSGTETALKKAIKKINKIEHEKRGVYAVENESFKHAGGPSTYLTQLDVLMQLELDSRDAVEDYLSNDMDPPSPPYPLDTLDVPEYPSGESAAKRAGKSATKKARKSAGKRARK